MSKNYLGKSVVETKNILSNKQAIGIRSLNSEGTKEEIDLLSNRQHLCDNDLVEIKEIGSKCLIILDKSKIRQFTFDDAKALVISAMSNYYIKVHNLSYVSSYGVKPSGRYKVGIFIHNVHHYSGGRYLGYLICMALAKYMDVVMVTDYSPSHFLKNFRGYEELKNFKIMIDINYGSKIEENDFDFVIGIPNEPAMYAQMYGERFGIPCYTIIFETPNYVSKFRSGADSTEEYWAGLKKHIPKMNGLIGISGQTTHYAKKWLEDEHFNNVNTIYPPINTHIADEVKVDENVVEEDRSIIFISRFVAHKNPMTLLEKLIEMKRPPSKIYLVGKIGGVTGDRIKKLQDNNKGVKIEAHLGCDDRRKFELIKKSKLLIFPTIFEGFGMPPTEAMYFGKQVLTYDIPVMKEVYGKYVHYVESKDDKAFINKIQKILDGDCISTPKEIEEYVRPWALLENYGHKLIHNLMPLRLSIGTIIFNGGDYIKKALDAVYPLAYEIIIVEGAVEDMMHAANKDGSSTDNTVKVIKAYKDPDNKIKFIQGRWENKNEMQNIIAQNVKGDIYMKMDADEIWKSLDIIKVLNMFRLDKHLMIVSPAFYHFWKNLKTITTGSQWNSMPTRFWRWFKGYRHNGDKKGFNYFVDEAGNKVAEPRCKTIMANDIHVYHLGYVRTNKRIKDKLEYYKKRNIEVNVVDTYTNWEKGQPTQPTHGGGITSKFNGILPEVLERSK